MDDMKLVHPCMLIGPSDHLVYLIDYPNRSPPIVHVIDISPPSSSSSLPSDARVHATSPSYRLVRTFTIGKDMKERDQREACISIVNSMQAIIQVHRNIVHVCTIRYPCSYYLGWT
jgi:hypothetical protein